MLKPIIIDFSEENIGQYICALFNSNGGRLETNVPDELNRTLNQIEDQIRSDIEPASIFYTDFDLEKNIYSIEIPSVEDKPYGYKGNIFVLTENYKVEKPSIPKLREMLKISSYRIERWERNENVDLTLDKLESTYRDIQNLSLPICKLINECKRIILEQIKMPGYVFDEMGHRQNIYSFPPVAIHEALVNAVAHRDYSNYNGGILINIAHDYLKIWNSGSLPPEIALSLKEHKPNYVSILHNPDIAKYLFLRQEMERTGKGSHTIINECNKMGVNVEWEHDPNTTGVTITFSLGESRKSIPEHLKKLINVLDGEMTRQEIQNLLDIKDVEHCRNHYIRPALENNLISMTIPDKPKSRNQKYYLSYYGKSLKNLK